MKSQAFDSKRRLTNICCFVVGLGLVKLVFAAYILAGGTLFSFNSTKQSADPKMEALAKAREQQRLALQKVNGELLVSQKNDAVSSQKAQSQVSDAAASQIDSQVVAAAPKQEYVQNTRQEKSVPFMAAEENDGVRPDLLIQASMATIGNMQTQNRRAVLENSFAGQAAQNQDQQAELGKTLDNVKPNYTHEPGSNSNDEGFSFSLVGTAHAEEVSQNAYSRPDQKQTTAVIPAPRVESKGYVSPDALIYKEKELSQKEEELLSLQEQMSSRMEELNQLENKLGDMVKEANSAEDEKYAHLIETYANMKPRKAAEALSILDEKIAVRILNGMKKKESGEIFSYMEPMHAARLSKAMTKIANPQ